MREILFRVWNTELKQYVQTDNTFINVNNGNVMEAQSIGNGYMLMIGSDKTHIVEQFTGLVDKNGTKIFEGDIVESCGDIYEVEFGEFNNGEMYEDERSGYGWYIRPFGNEANQYGEIIGVYQLSDYNIEVIGNIHEEDNNEKNNI